MTNSPPQRSRIWKKARIPLIAMACLVGLYLAMALAGGGWRPRLDDTFAWQGDSTLLFAHRGVDLSVPENSIASLAEARRLGFQAVEIDVRNTKDGVLMLFHDRYALRKLGLDMDSTELTWNRVKDCKLLFGGKPTTTGVPTLREVFQKFGKSPRYYLDMKSKGFKDADQIVAMIDEFGL